MKRRDFLRYCAATALGASSVIPSLALSNSGTDPFLSQAFPDTAGKQVRLDTYLGKPLVLNFWATWCPPCVKEMPDLDALQAKYSGVNIVGIAVDTASNVEKFGDKVQVSYPLLIAGYGGIESMRALGNEQGGLPFTVVFDKEGRRTQKILGQVDPAQLDRVINDML